jgi:tetratricopeptide (TPR) repeat protein
LYLLSNQNNKCFYYLERVKKNDLIKTFDEKSQRQIGLLYLKLANNYRCQTKDLEKTLLSYKYSAEFFEKLNYNDRDENDDKDFSVYCQILITIAKYSTIKQVIDDVYIDKILSVCKILEDDELKAKIYSDLSTLVVRLNKDSLNYHKAENLLKKAIGLANSENLFIQGIIYHNLGALYNRYSEYQKSIQSINKAIEFLHDGKNDELPAKLISDVYFNQGYAFAKLYRIVEAKDAFNSSLNNLYETGAIFFFISTRPLKDF